jgi:hypothetical protein
MDFQVGSTGVIGGFSVVIDRAVFLGCLSL